MRATLSTLSVCVHYPAVHESNVAFNCLLLHFGHTLVSRPSIDGVRFMADVALNSGVELTIAAKVSVRAMDV